MEQVIQVMMQLIASEIRQKPADVPSELFTETFLKRLCELSESQDMAHLVGDALGKLGLLPEGVIAERFRARVFGAVYRCEQISYVREKLSEALESAQIPFILLKGSVLCADYPESWMRTSCDIDVLIHKEDLERAGSYLVENLGYRYDKHGTHDVAFFSPQGVHVELHHDLIEHDYAKDAHAVLESVWERVHATSGKTYQQVLDEDMFYFYHVAHMAKHFENGGCGIRPLLDLWILDNREGISEKKRQALLDFGGLHDFAAAAKMLAEVWFSGKEHNDLTYKMQTYILEGGIYGAREHKIAAHQHKSGGKLGYALARIFLPYHIIKFHYPILQKHRWLTPFFEVCRWCKLLFCGAAKRSARELAASQSVPSEQRKKIEELFGELGL